ncbi:arginine--tRNA ligase [Geomicrobium sp. JCM 19039]|uniref:arginine--tRNA ligase n=1 Tax=Geomicrobium sp. JCM 19039 TaxID=1460636 RepID=UPI00045F4882|nr:arginyl-tRNA synthetase [Geomicrobium sp. JCM 19039]
MDVKQLTETKIAETLNLPVTTEQFEYPKQLEHGDLALPCFRFAKALKTSPHQIAQSIQQALQADELYAKIEVVGGYVNFFFHREKLAASILLAKPVTQPYQGTVTIDMSSPNIAKPFSMGHLRSTIIGESLARMYEHVGFRTVKINHLGDWGTQFGKLISAYKTWGVKEEIENNPIPELLTLYVRFHEEGDEKAGRRWFKLLEDGDDEAVQLWTWFKSESLKEFEKIYHRLGVRFDAITGESFYNDLMGAVVDVLKEKRLLIESDDAQVVLLEDQNLPPCLIQKNDGATLYATRDLAAAIYRKETYAFTQSLYVVGHEQSLHFTQIKAVLNKAGFDWPDDMEHVPFGLIRSEGKKMSTRKGTVILLEDVLDEAVALAKKTIQEKNPELPNANDVAEQIGVGAIIFNDLKNDRILDIDFSLENSLRFEGETGPYVQYTHARTCSILKHGTPGEPSVSSDLEWEMVMFIYRFEETVRIAVRQKNPSLIARYVLDLAQSFNRYYSQVKIVNDDAGQGSRLLIVDAVRSKLQSGLYLLGVTAPTKM